MELLKASGNPNPHDLSLHKQVKEIADLLKPELLQLYQFPTSAIPNVKLYQVCAEHVEAIRREITNQDALFCCQNILSHLKQAKDLSNNKHPVAEILVHLQEVMSILFKTQNLPS